MRIIGHRRRGSVLIVVNEAAKRDQTRHVLENSKTPKNPTQQT